MKNSHLVFGLMWTVKEVSRREESEKEVGSTERQHKQLNA